jgi:hypothetical protein
VAAGTFALAAALALTGAYWVGPSQAVIVDPVDARLGRLSTALIPGAAPAEEMDGYRPEVVAAPGLHLGWPGPFEERHAVTLEPQEAILQARVRQTGADEFDVLFVRMRFRITNARLWADHDPDGTGVERLAAGLSSVLENVIQQQRRDTRQALAQQNPSLANDQEALAARADQLVLPRLEETLRGFIDAAAGADSTRQIGVQVLREHESQLVSGVPADVAGAASGG